MRKKNPTKNQIKRRVRKIQIREDKREERRRLILMRKFGVLVDKMFPEKNQKEEDPIEEIILSLRELKNKPREILFRKF